MKIHCILHSRNLRSTSVIVAAYLEKEECIKHIEDIRATLQTLRTHKARAKEAIVRMAELDSTFDTNMTRTLNDEYWMQEIEIVLSEGMKCLSESATRCVKDVLLSNFPVRSAPKTGVHRYGAHLSPGTLPVDMSQNRVDAGDGKPLFSCQHPNSNMSAQALESTLNEDSIITEKKKPWFSAKSAEFKASWSANKTPGELGLLKETE